MDLFRSFRDLRIQHKLLAGYSAVFILCIVMGSLVVYSVVRQTLETNIESELKNTTTTILNMVRTSAATSIKNHLRAVAEKNLDIIVGNLVGPSNSGFASDINTVTFFFRDGTKEVLPSMEKQAIAHILLDRIVEKAMMSATQ